MTIKAIILHGTIVIDGYLVSALGEVSLAAMGIAAAIAGFVLGAIFAFSGAMQVRTAQAFGTGDAVFLKSVLFSGLAVSIGIGAIGLIAIWSFGPAIIASLTSDPETATAAWRYLSVFSLVVLGETVGQCLSSYFNGCGLTKVPLFGFALSLPLNVAASVVLIHGYMGFPAFGVAGAAMGSALAIGLQAVFFATQLVLRNGALFAADGWRQSSFPRTLKRHLSFSLPIATTFYSAALAGQVCMLIYAKMTLNAFAAMTLIMPWIMVTGQMSMQWAQATGIIVAQMLGANSSEKTLDRFLSSAWRGAFVTAAGVAGIFLVLCLSVNVLYPDLTIETRTILLGFLPILLILPFPKVSNAICGNTLRASGDTVYVMHIFLWAQWAFRVPATAIAVLHFGLPAFWVLSLLFWEEVVKFPLFHRRLHRGAWKHAIVTH